jgi:uncharacterized membrane protein
MTTIMVWVLCLILFTMGNMLMVKAPNVETYSSVLGSYSRFIGMVISILSGLFMILMLFRIFGFPLGMID